MGLALHGACASSHGHSHHHGHHHSADDSNRNINIRAAVIHVVGDLVQSVGVFISSIVIKFYVSTAYSRLIISLTFRSSRICLPNCNTIILHTAGGKTCRPNLHLCVLPVGVVHDHPCGTRCNSSADGGNSSSPGLLRCA